MTTLSTIFERSRYKCPAEKNGNDIRSQHTRGKKSSERIAIRRNRVLLPACLIIVNSLLSHGDSLWTPEFRGYLQDGSRVEIGDTVQIIIDADLSLSYESVSTDTGSFTLEFSGGEYGDLFSFLPQASRKQDGRVRGSDEYSFSSEVAARITEFDTSGLAYIEGGRTLSIGAKKESLQITGWIDLKDVRQDKSVSFSRIVDSRLVFQGFLDSSGSVLSKEDFEEFIRELPAATADAADEVPAGAESREQPSAGLRLSEEKKQELLLSLVNRLLDLLFQ